MTKKTTKPKAKPIPLDAIVLDDLTQSRQRTDPEVVEQYAELWREGVEFPPVDLFTVDGQEYYPGDGIHRCHAAVVAMRSSVQAIIHQGTLHDAQVFACQANKTHGLYRSNADKRHAVQRMLELEPKWSNRRVADHVGVGHQLVGEVRRALDDSSNARQKHRETKDGREYPAARKRPPTASHDSPPSSPRQGISGGATFDVKEIEGASVQAAIDVMAEIYKQATNDLNRIIRDFKAASEEEKTGVYLVDTITRITGYLNDAKGAIRMAEPVAECAQCEGGGCKSCANTGFITRMMQQAAGAK